MTRRALICFVLSREKRSQPIETERMKIHDLRIRRSCCYSWHHSFYFECTYYILSLEISPADNGPILITNMTWCFISFLSLGGKKGKNSDVGWTKFWTYLWLDWGHTNIHASEEYKGVSFGVLLLLHSHTHMLIHHRRGSLYNCPLSQVADHNVQFFDRKSFDFCTKRRRKSVAWPLIKRV